MMVNSPARGHREGPAMAAAYSRSCANRLGGLPGAILLLTYASALAVTACGSGSAPDMSGGTPPVIPPGITAQPANQSVPMGLSATFAVTATGSSPQFQWTKDGAMIAGATGGTYRTPATAFADSGAAFAVTVSNAAGSVTSTAAMLSVTARAPTAGDLRFQQVDAPYIVNGWGNAGVALSTFLLGRMAESFAPSIGTPFYVGSNGNCSPTPVTNGTGCAWAFSEFPYTATPADTVAAGYAGDFYDSFQTDLQSSAWPGFSNGLSPASPASVITSLDLEPASVLFGLSWVQSAQQTGFLMQQNTVAPADLQAAATHEGAAGRVITALSDNNGQITYLSYAWLADTATIYEARAVFTPTAGAVAAAATLAKQGYILTATGQADSSGNLVLVGTRVEGDSLPRPFVAAQGSLQVTAMQQQGYAPVGVIVDLTQTDPYAYLGER